MIWHPSHKEGITTNASITISRIGNRTKYFLHSSWVWSCVPGGVLFAGWPKFTPLSFSVTGVKFSGAWPWHSMAEKDHTSSTLKIIMLYVLISRCIKYIKPKISCRIGLSYLSEWRIGTKRGTNVWGANWPQRRGTNQHLNTFMNKKIYFTALCDLDFNASSSLKK